MDALERLLAIEELKRLKAKYFWGLDTKNWDFWRAEVWSSDGRLTVPEANRDCIGIDAIVDYVRDSTADQVSVHHGHTPNIDVTSDASATGVWVMEDRLFRSKEHPLEDGSTYLHGFGHYHETYVKTAQGWRIQTSILKRVRVQSFKIA